MKNRTDVINSIIKETGANSYSQYYERDGGENFDNVNCKEKHRNKAGTDIVFIDTNKAEDVDFSHLENGSILIVHNVVPASEKHKSFDLCGDVYKIMSQAGNYYNKLYDQDFGTVVIYPKDDIVEQEDDDIYAAYEKKFGKKPHGKMKESTIRKKLQE